jgi:Xaa-Pro aminopeptidase
MMNSKLHSSRVKKIQQQLLDKQIALITNPADISYLAGFTTLVSEEREAYLVISRQTVILVHALFSPDDTPLPCQKKAGCSPQNLAAAVDGLAQAESLTELLIDETSLTVYEHKPLTELSLKLSPLDRELIWQLRMIKSQPEIELMAQAGQVAAQAFAQVVSEQNPESSILKPGMTELELKQLLEAALMRLGSQRPAFPTIVAFGPNGAKPHHQPTDTKLKKEMPVLIDFGATIQGYRSDMTRSFWYGDQPSSEFSQVAKVIEAAYQAALDQIGTTATQIDQAARETITQAGYADYFIHTTGHGLGLDIHEPPSISSRSTTKIEPGMVITIEPGIYLPKKFGYRWENTFLVTKTGCQQLTLLP